MESENMFMKRKGLPTFFSCALISISALLFGGTALAATAPIVKLLPLIDKYVDPAGNVIEKEIKMNGMAMPHGVAMDGRFNIYVADPLNQEINLFGSNGKLVKKIRSVKVPTHVSVKEDGSQIYATGNNSDGSNSVFILNENGVVGGNLGGWVQPGDTVVTSSGDLLGTDSATNATDTLRSVIKRYSGGDLSKEYGPYTWKVANEVFTGNLCSLGMSGCKYDSTKGTTTFDVTKHTVVPAGGLAVNGSRISIAVSEYIEWGSITYTTACDPTNQNGTGCYQENNLYMYPLGDYFWVPMIDMVSGKIVKIDGNPVSDDYSDLVRTYALRGFTSQASCSSCLPVNPKGLAIDDKSRLYVSTGQGIRVFGTDDGKEITVSGFPATAVMDIYFDRINSRLLVGVNDSVLIYGIDGGINPANAAPTAPALVSPIGSYVNSLTPSLEISNGTDQEGDLLTYAYEITLGDTVASNGTGYVQGSNGNTLMTVNNTLIENMRYHWRAQSFDGNSASPWTEKAEFCVNTENDVPETPSVKSPVDLAPVSPFGTILTWDPSRDADCYDTWTYTIEISNDQDFTPVLRSKSNLAGVSVPLSQIANDLANGNVYYWRVKAVDNNSGESPYSTGSFTYKTTAVKFSSDQPGAKVYIDGNYGYFGRLLSTAPFEIQNGITPGAHFVTFEKAGYEPYHTVINVADPLDNNGVVEVHAAMVKASKIRPSLPGAELFKINGGSAAPFVVDFNNDGLKDIVAGGKVNVYNDSGELEGEIDGRLYLYLSEIQPDGTNKLAAKGALQVGDSDINVGTRAVPFVVDYDNDGKKDLLIGGGDGLIRLYLNNGSDNAPAFAVAGTLDVKVMSNAAPVVVDYNNDGKKDLVVGSSEGTLKLYVNVGTDEAPIYDIPVTVKADNADISIISGNSKAFFTDWNSDGKKDLVVGGNGLHLFFNVGTDVSPDFRSVPGLQIWIKDKKRERGNREFIPYLGYSQDIGSLAGDAGDAAPFVVNWDGSSAGDVIVGDGSGSVIPYFSVD